MQKNNFDIITLAIVLISFILFLWLIDFKTIFLVVLIITFYRYLHVKASKQQLEGFNQSVYEISKLVKQYLLLGIDKLIEKLFI